MYLHRKLRLIDPSAAPLDCLLAGHCHAIDEALEPGYRYRIRNTSYLAVMLTVGGCSDYSVNGAARRIEPGSLLVLPPGISFSEHVPGPDPCHNIYLMLHGPLAGGIARLLPPGADFHYLGHCPAAVERSLRAAVRLFHEAPAPDPWLAGAALCQLGAALAEALTRPAAPSALVLQVERLVAAQPAANWTLPRLAGRCGMSESSFAHRFAREAGTPPAAFVRGLRCRMARDLLQQGVAVAEAAERLGFPNPYHFSRVFKAVTGSPPSQHKQRRPLLHRPA